MTEISVYVVIGSLIISKIGDVVSTLKRIRQAQDETNPFVQKIMMKYDTVNTTWFVLFLSLIIIAASGMFALHGDILTQILFVFIGIIITIIQSGVAHSNWTGRMIIISKLVHKIHSEGHRILTR